MKPNLLNFFRKQNQISKFIVFLLCWTQLHAYSLNNFIYSNKKITPLMKVDYTKDKEYSKTQNNTENSIDENLHSIRSNTKSDNKHTDKFSSSFFPRKSEVHYYFSDLQEGIIGVNNLSPIDQVYDNVFIIDIPDEIKSDKTYYLEYDLYGLKDHTSVSKFINDEIVGKNPNIEVNNTWSHQKEMICYDEINKGKNYVTFTIPKNANYYYKVKNIKISFEEGKNYIIPKNKSFNLSEKFIDKSEESSLSYESAKLDIGKDALKEGKTFSISSLNEIDLPVLNSEIINVTAQSSGYRFLPHGEHFVLPAKVSIGYDKTKIPVGYTEQDIRTYYFDRNQKKWLVLEKDSLITNENILVSKTTHFTDMINGIIKVPESPETGNYTPNSIKDIKAANPTEGVVNIPPPTPNNMGTLTTSFPLKIPAGRSGIQPSLSINYSSDGGNSWLGQGWNLSTPSISIDTRWGTPSYDNIYESETYTYNGEQLTFKNINGEYTMSHRISAFKTKRDSITISDITRFYPRVEGGYEKVLRHGTSPNNYWWEIISKDGTKYIYGYDDDNKTNENYTLKDSNGNIGYWALYKIIDADGNYAIYNYEKITYTENKPGQNGKELYLKEIVYTKSTKNTSLKLYKVSFDKSGGRSDIRSDARMGFLRTESQLLNRINIYYDNNFIRAYKLNYKPSDYKTLFKSVLSDISEVYIENGQEKVFYTHRFNYYEAPSADSSFDVKKPINAGGGVFNDTAFKSRGDYSGNYSIINGSKTSSNGTNFRLGVGFVKGFKSLFNFNVGTIGAHYGTNKSNTNIKTFLIDIDGDGLLDKVFLKGNSVSYSSGREEFKNNSETDNCGSYSYNNVKTIQTINSLGHSVDYSSNYGAAWLAKYFNIGVDKNSGKSINDQYFFDFNGDGLVDFVKDNKVYFNRIKNGIPTFIEDSAETPVPIFIKECITNKIEPIFSGDEITEMEKNNPLHDIVRVWVAPRNGVIDVVNKFNLVDYGACPKEIDCTKLDGVAVSFQKSDSDPIVKNINAGDFTTYNLNASSLNIQKGEKLFFRVSSKYNGDLDKVNWNPTITYTDINSSTITVDENKKSLLVYNANEDFTITPSNIFQSQETGSYNLEVSYKNTNILSDDVKLALYIDGVEDTASTITLESGKLFDSNYSKVITIDKDKTAELKVLSDSNIHWPDLFVKAKLSKLNSNDNSLNFVQDIQNVVYSYNKKIGNYIIYNIIPSISGPIYLDSDFIPKSSDNGRKFTITAKIEGKLIAKKSYTVSNGILTISSFKDYTITNLDFGKKMYLEVSTPEYNQDFIDRLLASSHNLKKKSLMNNYLGSSGNKSFSVIDLRNLSNNNIYSGNLHLESNASLKRVYGFTSSYGGSYFVGLSIGPSFGDYFGCSSGYNDVKSCGDEKLYPLTPGDYLVTLTGGGNQLPAGGLHLEIVNESNAICVIKNSLSSPYLGISSEQDLNIALSNTSVDQRFGQLYRGWGAFSLNGNITKNPHLANTGTVQDMKIDVTKLKMTSLSPGWKTDGLYDEDENNTTAPDVLPYSLDTDGNPIIDNSFLDFANQYFTPVYSSAVFLKKPDSDGDGVPDTDDNCPDEAGDVINGGCTTGNPFIGESYDYIRKWISLNYETYVDREFLSSSRKGIPNIQELVDLENDLICNTKSYLMSAPSFVTENESTSAKVGANLFGGNLSFGASTNLKSQTKSVRSLLDFNGDGFPDDYILDKISLSNSLGYRSGNVNSIINNLDVASLSKANNNGVSSGFGFSHGKSSRLFFINTGTDGMSMANQASGENGGAHSLSVNVDYNKNIQNVEHNYVDINGDGLPDRYDNKKFELNVTKGFFDNSRDWANNDLIFSNSSSDSFSAGLGLSIFKGSFDAGSNYSTSKDKVNKELLDINNDGLPDVIDYSNNMIYINAGNTFYSYGSTKGIYLQSINKSTSYGGNAAGTILIPIVFPAIFTIVGIKITTTIGKSSGTTVGFTEAAFKDMDGDGYVDMVTASDSNSGFVYKNLLSQVNLLKEVVLASGGSWECEYKKSDNTYDSPHAKMVLSYCDIKNNATKSYGKLDQHYNVEYKNGFYSRFERSFYGFETVRTIASNKTSLEEKYYNNSYYKKGLLKEKTSYSGSFDKKINSEVNNYILRDRSTQNSISDISIANTVDDIFVRDEDKFIYVKEDEKKRKSFSYFPTPSLITKTVYEINGGSKSTKSEFISYDSYGNLTSFKDYGDQEIGNSEILTSTVSYQTTDNASQYLSLPTIVSTTGTTVSREREAQYNSNGDLLKVEIKNYTDGTSAIYDFEYDDYGNIIKSTGPANADNQRFYHEYVYDDKVATYPIQVKDAFGYSSKSTYDFKLGVPLYTEEMNLQPMKYKYDAFGRTTDIVGPYELFNNIDWTIHFTYPSIFTANKTYNEFFAITEHYNPEFPSSSIKTITISDGLGSPVQVKKSASIFNSSTKQEEQKFIVSGFVDEYKPGLPGWSYYPTIESVGASNTSFNTNYDTSVSPTVTTYDIFNRAISTTLPDGGISQISYDFSTDYLGRKMMETTFTDELGKIKKTYTDIKGRTTTVKEINSIGDITTSFTHDAVGNILEVRDTKGNLTKSTYDDFGRRTKLEHPDSGISTYEYDLAGNLISRKNAKNQTITYDYDYSRLKAVNYPDFPENNVKYFYGKAKDQAAMDNNSVGRLTYQSDATGTQMFKYGKLGELVYNRRSVAVPGAGVYWFDTSWEYDTWNRVKSIIYSDGEKVTYTYNQGGNLKSMSSVKDGYTQSIIDDLGYDKFEQRVYLKYGNGTETTYDYEADRRRLASMKAQTSAAKGSRLFMDNAYVYDKVSNVKSVKNNATILTGLLGGGTEMTYNYDDLYRLTSATGTWNGYNTANQIEKQRYDVAMSYDELHNVTEKKQKHDKSLDNGTTWAAITPTSYRLTYSYDAARPHAPKQIVDEPGTNAACCSTTDPTVNFEQYTYDAVGNPTEINKKISDTQNVKKKTFIWDEENRLRFVDTNPSTPDVDGAAIYTYDAGGERIIKQVSHSSSVLLPEQVSTTATTSEYSIYPNGLINASISYSNNKFNLKYTKHYYAGSQRVSSRLGLGANVGSFNCNWLITPFGSGATDINEKSTAKAKLEANTAACLAIMQANSITLPINYGQNAGYAENCVSSYTGTAQEKDVYWYHPDHLGSSSFITGLDGEVTQSIEYFPSGEVFVENHKNSYNTPYKFNGKEQDSETGYYYYGARYYNPRVSLWLNVDPLAEKYPSMSPYIYCANNPINAIDPDGRWIIYVNNSGINYVYKNGNFYVANIYYNKDTKQYSVENTGKRYNPAISKGNPTMYQYLKALRKIENGGNLISRGQIKQLANDKLLHLHQKGAVNEVTDPVNPNNTQLSMNYGKKDNDSKHTLTTFNINDLSGKDWKGIESSSIDELVAHETQHEYDEAIGNSSDDTGQHNQDNPIEIRAVYTENIQRVLNGKKTRTRYGGEINKKSLKNPPNFKRPKIN
ncbi:SpvB/TcaC N-terminal domain-containing protein [Cloacibacterium sp.]|uniref:SpvB/TcaC N-terminal domain-containing protein n=1 Tax=Cloacibacterium sp. TaxID=1913682 RepID=UPI0039E4E57D